MAFDLRQKVFRIPSDTVVSVGLKWDFIGADPVDLDLSAVCFTKEGMLLDCVFFNHPFPTGIDDEALRFSDAVVDSRQLPYMFVSDDSRIGGEEENQLPGLALAARRRRYQLRNTNDAELKRMGVMDAIFSRIYEEGELEGVESALDERRGGGHVFDEEGRALGRLPRREFCDEMLTFVMHKIPSNADVIFIAVTSYTGADLTTLPSAKLVIVNETANKVVGEIDIKHATGNGTANLACMLCRLPPSRAASTEPEEQQLWDLRELNIRTFGYTFVDVLPVMFDTLGVEKNSRDDALHLLPDYSLTKEAFSRSTHALSDVRFGVGWHGEHDIDAFMVMLDGDNRYIDHLFPKQRRLHSAHPHAARHSGDAITGFGTTGDEEFIDLLTYRIPLEVRTIIFGAIYVESFGSSAKNTESIFDVPKLYMRLQNRTVEWPNSFEVDRWNIHYEVAEEASARKKGKKQQQQQRQSRTPHTYRGPDGKTYPVRMAVLGLMVKRSNVPRSMMYPHGHLHQLPSEQQQQQLTGQSLNRCGEDSPEEEVPFFEYCSLHEYTPASVLNNFSAALPYLYGIAHHYHKCSSGNDRLGDNPRIGIPRVLKTDNNLPGWDMPLAFTYSQSMWEEIRSSGKMLTRHAVRVQFLEVRDMQPTLPQSFKCHGEAWVCDGANSTQRTLTESETPPFRTPYLIHRDNMRWDDKNPATSALFFVRRFDRIRVVIYEYASFGFVDLDLVQFPDLCQPESSKCSNKDGANNYVDKWFQLNGSGENSGMLRLRLYRASAKEALDAYESIIREKNKRRKCHERRLAERRDAAARKEYSGPCGFM